MLFTSASDPVMVALVKLDVEFNVDSWDNCVILSAAAWQTLDNVQEEVVVEEEDLHHPATLDTLWWAPSVSSW